MSHLIWDDEDAPGIDSLSDEELQVLTKKMASELVLMLELDEAKALGQIH